MFRWWSSFSYPGRKLTRCLNEPAMSTTRTIGSRPQPILPAAAKPGFELPPPPTRSRRIIQMEPASQQKEQINASGDQSSPAKGLSHKKGLPGAASNAMGKKQPSSTSAAGKKMARKTAHSVIERRRRSKVCISGRTTISLHIHISFPGKIWAEKRIDCLTKCLLVFNRHSISRLRNERKEWSKKDKVPAGSLVM